jgi:hypothetical protein
MYMIRNDIIPFIGEHCETTATGTLLNQLSIHLSEPILFGLGEGLSFIVWNMKGMDFPFIGGRNKPDLLTYNICKNLNLSLSVKETSSVEKAWKMLKACIDQQHLAGLKMDCYHLDYFTRKTHFAGHYAAIYGYDDTHAYLIDTKQQGGKVKTTLKSLEMARNERGAMASRNLMYTISSSGAHFDLQKSIYQAIKNNAAEYLNPPISNISYRGIQKTGIEIKKWFLQLPNVSEGFITMSMLMEKAGTGGALFRNLFRDFLKESYAYLEISEIAKAYYIFSDIADQWTQIAYLFDKAGHTLDRKYINQASEILFSIAEEEKKAMEILKDM